MNCTAVKGKFLIDCDCCIVCHEWHDEFGDFYKTEINHCVYVVCCKVASYLYALGYRIY